METFPRPLCLGTLGVFIRCKRLPGGMGDAKAIKLEPASAERRHAGATCLRCDFTADAGWGGE